MTDANIHFEKRTHPRISLNIRVKYRPVDEGKDLKDLGDWRKSEKNTHSLDLSLGGIYILLDHQAKMGDILNLELGIDDKTSLRVFAEVMWANAQGAGLKFMMIKPQDLEKLKVVLARASTP